MSDKPKERKPGGILEKILKGVRFLTNELICLANRIQRFFKGGDFQKCCMDEKTYYWPFGIFLTHFLLLVGRFVWCLFWIQARIISVNPIYLIVMCIAPFLYWAMSSMCEKYNTHGWKKTIFWLCIYHALFTLLQCTWLAMYNLVVIHVMHIRITETMTEMMVVNLARICLLSSVLVPGFAVMVPIKRVLKESSVEELVTDFKLQDIVDMRPNKEVAYDISIMKDVKGFGKKLSMLEQDLYTHVMLVGPSGTGKTSTSISPALINLLEKKCKNRKKRTDLLMKMLQENKAYLRGPVRNPTEYDIIAKPQYIKELEKIYTDYPDIGITCVSPNDGIGNAVVRFSESAGIRVNMVDPEKHYEESCVTHLGINPFFLPDNLTEKEKIVRIISNATSFSEILLAVNEAVGAAGGDQYFRDLNTSVTSNIATIVMLYASITGTNATLGVIQNCINDFSLMYEMCRTINETYGFGIEILNPKEMDKNRKNTKNGTSWPEIDTDRLNERRNREEEEEHPNLDAGVAGKSGANYIEALMKGAVDIYRPMRITLQYVNNDLFLNGDKMYDQSRGLRNILNQMISHPDIFAILNAQENYIDFDKIFNECEVTVVNSSVRIGGQKGSSALGLFFLLNHCNAVQRRYRDNNHPRLTQPHILITDESAQYVHSWMSQAVNLFRQYKCACLFSFQSLSQLERNAAYRDIKDSLLQVGNIIAYGRLGVNEMETFEKLSGTRNVVQFQEQLSRSSILAEDPTANVGVRRMESEQANVSGSKARLKRFREATWFRYINGDVLPPLDVIFDFAKMDYFDGKGYSEYDWSEFYDPQTEEFADVIEEEMKEDVSENTPAEQALKKSLYEEDSLVLEQLHKGADGELVSEEIVGKTSEETQEKPVEKERESEEEKEGVTERVFLKDAPDGEDHKTSDKAYDLQEGEDKRNDWDEDDEEFLYTL